MKTSTKIFLGLAAAAVALCVVNGVVACVMAKKYNAEAQRVVELLDATRIRVLEITYSPKFGTDHVSSPLNRNAFSVRDTNVQYLDIAASLLENVRIEGETMYIDNYDNKRWNWRLFSSPSLETVVIRQNGAPDQVIDVRVEAETPAETEAEGAPEAAAD